LGDLLAIIARILAVRERKPAHMSVIFSEAGPGEDRQLVGRTGNLSGNGMLLLSGKRVQAGSLLNLEFVVPGTSHTIKVQAKVTRVNQDSEGTYGAGVHFLGLSDSDQAQIVGYVSA